MYEVTTVSKNGSRETGGEYDDLGIAVRSALTLAETISLSSIEASLMAAVEVRRGGELSLSITVIPGGLQSSPK